EVPAFFRGDDTEVFALCFGAFADTAAYTTFEFMRGADAAVTLLDLDGEGHAVVEAKAAPGAANAAFDGAKRFTIGVTAFEAGVDKFFPDGRQVADVGAEEVDALAAGDLGIELILFCYFSEYDEFVGGDLAAGDAG